MPGTGQVRSGERRSLAAPSMSHFCDRRASGRGVSRAWHRTGPNGRSGPAERATRRAEPRGAADTIFGMRYETVLFDLDGTLIDSGAIILASFRHATREVLRRELSDEQLLTYVGGPHLGEQMRTIDAERAEELVAAYRAHNEPLHAELLAFEGIADVLGTLRAEARQLGIVTSKRRATVQLAFDVVPLEEYFDVVVTSDDTARHKPNPDPVLHALERLDARRDSAVYVGDSPFDLRAAKAAGVAAIGVTWGKIHDRAVLLAERPSAVVDSPAELVRAL